MVPRLVLHLVASWPKLLRLLHDLGRHRHLLRRGLLLEVVRRLPVEVGNVRVRCWQGLLPLGYRCDVVDPVAADPEVNASNVAEGVLDAHAGEPRGRRHVRSVGPRTRYSSFSEQHVV